LAWQGTSSIDVDLSNPMMEEHPQGMYIGFLFHSGTGMLQGYTSDAPFFPMDLLGTTPCPLRTSLLASLDSLSETAHVMTTTQTFAEFPYLCLRSSSVYRATGAFFTNVQVLMWDLPSEGDVGVLCQDPPSSSSSPSPSVSSSELIPPPPPPPPPIANETNPLSPFEFNITTYSGTTNESTGAATPEIPQKKTSALLFPVLLALGVLVLAFCYVLFGRRKGKEVSEEEESNVTVLPKENSLMYTSIPRDATTQLRTSLPSPLTMDCVNYGALPVEQTALEIVEEMKKDEKTGRKEKKVPM